MIPGKQESKKFFWKTHGKIFRQFPGVVATLILGFLTSFVFLFGEGKYIGKVYGEIEQTSQQIKRF